MPSYLRQAENAVARRLRRNPPAGFVARSTFWLGALVLLLISLRVMHLWRGDTADVFLFLFSVPLTVFAIILVWRWTFRNLLWHVRNRLIVTYLLMGLAPVVLFVTLASIAAYLFSGQFATFAATAELDAQEQRLSAENMGFAIHVGHVLEANPKLRTLELPESEEAATADGVPVAALTAAKSPNIHALAVGAELDGLPVVLTTGGKVMVSDIKAPAWATPGFHGLVMDDGHLYFRAVDDHVSGQHKVVLVSSLLVSSAMLEQMAKNLGSISIMPGFTRVNDDPSQPEFRYNRNEAPHGDSDHDDKVHLSGGKLPPAATFYDRRVLFTAPLAIVNWQTGHKEPSRLLLNVTSRPTLLYQRLFGNSVQLGVVVRDALITIAVLFGVLELTAFIMAIGLSRTITQSISDLYGATRAIDSGNLEHRIIVRRKDQLAALSNSFNTMSNSLSHLLEQQREKERLLSELSIAHEVQSNLLPQGQIRLPMLEVHGVSKPARGVSGDYYDFLLTGSSQLALALGDISGKGISAALLMASLHSAVRAYRYGDSDSNAPLLDGEANLLAHPAKMLERLNRHLYTSTQAAKYATLFLAHYDGADQSLTYSTGGQLPPLLLCANNEVKRLDCGGTVVGLLDGMKYEQAAITMSPGDILVIYSDGVTEPENEYGDFGEDRLLDLVRRNRASSLETISNSIMQALTTWIGEQEQPDDITLVLARQL